MSRRLRSFTSLGALTAFIILVTCLLPGCRTDERWTDEALLADGRTIEVARSVSFHFGRGELSDALTSWPDQYALSAQNPDTGMRFLWSGEQHFNPILLDFWKKKPYLVAVASSTLSNLEQYGCPDIPYIFFRYDESKGHWDQIPPKDFPPQILHANLSFRHDGTYMKNGAKQSKENIEERNALSERSSGNFTTRTIPTNFVSWPYRHKNEYRVGHYQDGCRHAVPSNEDPTHPQSAKQPSQDIVLEVLETKIYEPEWIIKGDANIQFREWDRLAWDGEKSAKCRALVRRVGNESEQPNLRGWLLFNKDPSGTKKARDSGTIFCDTEMIWFVDYGQGRRHVSLTKFTTGGDFVYRLTFKKPDEPDEYAGGIMQPTFHAEDGYLYFEWWNTNQSGWSRHVKRSIKARVREPQANASSPDKV